MLHLGNKLQTDDLQFGFKGEIGCNNAIFVLNQTINHFNKLGSSVYGAALDFKKAFDRVHHLKLFKSLMDAKLPKYFISLLCNWYAKMFVSVKWNGTFSKSFQVRSGVRQGSSLSPGIFNLFVDTFIKEIKLNDTGCKINNKFVGIIMYADDLIILSASVQGLQSMLDCCTRMSYHTNLNFNVKKCLCFVVGPTYNDIMPAMLLCSESITWSKCFKYLGVNFVCNKTLQLDVNVIKRKFYASCNAVICNSGSADEIVKLSLCESFCIPLLVYGVPFCNLNRAILQELNVCWNSVMRRIFGFHRWESIRDFISNLGRMDFIHIRMLHFIKFCKFGLQSRNDIFKSSIRKFLSSSECRDIFCLENASEVNFVLGLSAPKLKRMIMCKYRAKL